MPLRLTVYAFLILEILNSFLHSTTAADSENGSQTCSSSLNDDGTCNADPPSLPSQCNLYLAPSTIPNAGLGVFTTIPLETGHTFDGDVIYPVLSLDTSEYYSPFENFVWDAPTLGMTMETGFAEDLDGQCPGLDAVLNCNLALINVKRSSMDYNDNIGGHRSISPSAGSMTPYHNGRSKISANIPAGGELFKSYGDKWFEERKLDFGLVPLTSDYDHAEQLLRKLRHVQDDCDLSRQARQELYSIIIDIQFESRTIKALPWNYTHVDTIVKESMRAWHQQNATRSTHELQETGRCIDNIRHGESNLPFAGRGAFATRDISKGSILTGSPIIHVPTLKMAVMRNNTNTNATAQHTNHNTTHYHLWINYCMGHHDADMLLCPYGLGVNYINHNQSLANVRFQWSPDGIMSQNSSWFEKSNWTYNEVRHTHLGMDYIATRDIRQGEELLMDYGDEWEQAWKNHVEKWKPSQDDKAYVSARQWNKEHANDVLRTQEEQESNPYPSNLLIRCATALLVRQTEEESWSKTAVPWRSQFDPGQKCQILNKSQGENDTDPTYTVYMMRDKRARTEHNVPRSGIKMIDAPNSTDWHRRDAFRQWIGIPDHMFPEAWRTKRKQEEDL